MRKNLFIGVIVVLFLLVSVVPVMAQRGDDSKRKSKNGKLEGAIDGVDVMVEYGRPMVKGREIWGGLVPWDKIWRTGADEATKITLSKDVLIEGKKLAAGAYSLFTIPGKEEWTIVFNSVAKQWGAFRYDESKDVLRVKVKAKELKEPVEEMTFKIKGNMVVLVWEKLAVPFTIAAAN